MDNKVHKSVRPTKKQRELLSYIEGFITEHGYGPSYREIMAGCDYSSVATVALHVNNLIDRGHLRKKDRSARALELVSPNSQSSRDSSINSIKQSEEKWLVDQIEERFREAELGNLSQPRLDDLYVLTGSLKVLGLEAAARGFMPRLAGLKSKL